MDAVEGVSECVGARGVGLRRGGRCRGRINDANERKATKNKKPRSETLWLGKLNVRSRILRSLGAVFFDLIQTSRPHSVLLIHCPNSILNFAPAEANYRSYLKLLYSRAHTHTYQPHSFPLAAPSFPRSPVCGDASESESSPHMSSGISEGAPPSSCSPPPRSRSCLPAPPPLGGSKECR